MRRQPGVCSAWLQKLQLPWSGEITDAHVRMTSEQVGTRSSVVVSCMPMMQPNYTPDKWLAVCVLLVARSIIKVYDRPGRIRFALSVGFHSIIYEPVPAIGGNMRWISVWPETSNQMCIRTADELLVPVISPPGQTKCKRWGTKCTILVTCRHWS